MEINNKYTFWQTIKIGGNEYIIFAIIASIHWTVKYQLWNIKDNTYDTFDEWQLECVEEKTLIWFDLDRNEKENETVWWEFNESWI